MPVRPLSKTEARGYKVECKNVFLCVNTFILFDITDLKKQIRNMFNIYVFLTHCNKYVNSEQPETSDDAAVQSQLYQ